MSRANRLPPSPRFSPTVHLSDRNWEKIVQALIKHGGIDQAVLAGQIDKQLQESRRAFAARQQRVTP